MPPFGVTPIAPLNLRLASLGLHLGGKLGVATNLRGGFAWLGNPPPGVSLNLSLAWQG